MNKKEFEGLIQRIKTKNPEIFSLDSDCPARAEGIEMMEKYYDVVFPESYKDFLLQCGGGYFGFKGELNFYDALAKYGVRLGGL